MSTLIEIENLTKTLGGKDLFKETDFSIQSSEKVALIGRNGLGKTTLLKLITNSEQKDSGEINIAKNIRIVMTAQEHHFSEEVTALDYILDVIPGYRALMEVTEDYKKFGDAKVSLERYCDAIDELSSRDLFTVEEKVVEALDDLQVDIDKAMSPIKQLSGGQKRFVELVKVTFAQADIALIDEPTNHMDYHGKEKFINWLRSYDKAVLVVTHDRDVLQNVDAIVELKDFKLHKFKGNYDKYIQQNSIANVSSITKYELDSKKMVEVKKQMENARGDIGRARSDGARNSAKVRFERFKKEYETILEQHKKPSIWIDKESLDDISDKVVEKYHKYKDRNIRIQTTESAKLHKKLLLRVDQFSLGYTQPLFDNVNFQVHIGDRLFIKGRNGAGKSTLVKYLIHEINEANREFVSKQKIEYPSTLFAGEVKLGTNVRIGVYEQEIDAKYLELKLGDAIEKLYWELKLEINDQEIKRILSNYLFNPSEDKDLEINKLSGGQKARFQLIKMFANKPNLLFLDEPTNHLDLPSIEELENSLSAFQGGIIYISHDSYFVEGMGGEVVEIASV